MDVDAQNRWAVDRSLILDLTARYNRAFDSGDAEGYADLFTADGVMEVEGGPRFEGRDALAAMCANTQAAIRHVTTDPVVTVDGDTAVQEVTLLVVARPAAGQHGSTLQSSGRYVDDLVRTAEGWRFARRRATLDGGL